LTRFVLLMQLFHLVWLHLMYKNSSLSNFRFWCSRPSGTNQVECEVCLISYPQLKVSSLKQESSSGNSLSDMNMAVTNQNTIETSAMVDNHISVFKVLRAICVIYTCFVCKTSRRISTRGDEVILSPSDR
jgi:hypothetical protein